MTATVDPSFEDLINFTGTPSEFFSDTSLPSAFFRSMSLPSSQPKTETSLLSKGVITLMGAATRTDQFALGDQLNTPLSLTTAKALALSEDQATSKMGSAMGMYSKVVPSDENKAKP